MVRRCMKSELMRREGKRRRVVGKKREVYIITSKL